MNSGRESWHALWRSACVTLAWILNWTNQEESEPILQVQYAKFKISLYALKTCWTFWTFQHGVFSDQLTTGQNFRLQFATHLPSSSLFFQADRLSNLEHQAVEAERQRQQVEAPLGSVFYHVSCGVQG